METLPLRARQCEPCRGEIPPLSAADIQPLHEVLRPGWKVVNDHHLEKEFSFPDFREALSFVQRVGEIAEQQDHHPDLHFGWGYAHVVLWTHKAHGLTVNDFIVAAQIDEAELSALPALPRAH